ncbi:MAG: HEPN domain-containing protein [Bacteroidetes bacterium]|nr:HEPN domain-containing protein [Bacteroidota bacterium]
MDYLKQKDYWIEASEDDLILAENIFNSGSYDWALFIAHLSLEKLLKAYFTYSKKEIPPKVYKLEKIAELASLEFDENQIKQLKLINEFNIQTRYPDQKKKFKSICTKEFAEEHIAIIKNLRKWILEKIK